MAERYHRAQILLEPEQYKALARMARQHGCSISQLVREIMSVGLRHLQTQKQHKRDALNRLDRLRAAIQQTHGPYPGDPVQEVRVQRAAQMQPGPESRP